MSFNFGAGNTGSGGSGFSFGGNAGGFSLAKQTTAPTTTTVSGGLFSSSGGGGFSFGGAPTQQQPASTGSGFSFGAPAATPKPAFSFTPAATSSQPASTGFSFAPATAPAQQPSSGFSFAGAGGGFGSNPTSTSSSFGGGFSLNKQATAPSIPAFGLGSSGTGESLTGGSKPITSLGTAATHKNAPIGGLGGGFTFSTPGTVPTNNAGGFKLGSFAAQPAQNPSQSTTNTAAPLGGTFSLTTPQSTVPSGGFSLTAPSNTQTTNPALSGFGLGTNKISAAPPPAAAPTSFGFGSSTTAVTSAPAPSTGGFSFGGNTSATPLSTPATTSGTPSSLSSGFKLGTGTSLFPSSTTLSQSLTATSSVVTPTLAGSASTPSLKLPTVGIATVTTAATAPTSSTTSTPSMRYKDLENKVNTWMGELEQQEKLFLTQATHVNAWNKLLIENADKITTLNDEFENVSLNQKRLNEELDLVKMQHNELEELLKPLEENMKQQMSSLSSSMHTHHADIERERTYNLAENIDGQLKTMVQDLREVVEHINSTSTPGNENNPIMQIGKILSAHMDSLQWLDSNSGSLQLKVQELSKQVDKMKKEHESKFRLAFN